MKANEILNEVFGFIGTTEEVAAALRAAAERYTHVYMVAKANEEKNGNSAYIAHVTAGDVLEDISTLQQLADTIEGKE